MAVRPVDMASVGASPTRSSTQSLTVARLARWLLVAVALDLLVTRFVVRLAMFVPKGEPWATLARVLGRVAAATDVLVPIVGVLVLGVLLLRSARAGDAGERVILAMVGLVAAGGFALVVLPPSPALVMALDLLAGGAAMGAVVGLRNSEFGTPLVRPGIVALGAALALVAVGRALGVSGAMGWAMTPAWGAAAGASVGVWAQLAFVTGAGLIGMAGILTGRAEGPMSCRRLVVAVVVTVVVVATWWRSPASWDSLAIWSLGLSGAVPVILVAAVLGSLVVGLPSLHRRLPMVAVGVSIVLAAGVGLAASGLTLAGLLGLVVAGSEDDERAAATPVPRR